MAGLALDVTGPGIVATQLIIASRQHDVPLRPLARAFAGAVHSFVATTIIATVLASICAIAPNRAT